MSPDRTKVVTGQLGSAWLWDVRSGRGRRLLEVGDLDDVDGAAFSPDGARVAVSARGNVVLWDFVRNRRIATLRGHTASISFLRFSADGSRLVTAADDETARLWDGGTGEPVAVLRDYANDITSANFSRDGRFLVTTSGDDAIRVADAATGRDVATVRTATGAVFGATIVGRSRQSVATHASGRPWLETCEICGPLDDLLELARRRETRELTRSETARYLH